MESLRVVWLTSRTLVAGAWLKHSGKMNHAGLPSGLDGITELLDGEIFYTLREAQIDIESWRRHFDRALQHPSVYVIEEKRLC
jgi:hypothetical protein